MGKWANGQMGINVLTIANANVRGPRQAITKVTLTLIGILPTYLGIHRFLY